MYKKNRNRQYCITDFDQPMGMKLDPENRWVKRAKTIPWDDIEDRYAEPDERNNKGTLIIDATCAPQNISYPQDINLLNEARENLESDQTAAAVCKAGSEVCEGVSGRREGFFRKTAGKTSCERESIRAAEIHV